MSSAAFLNRRRRASGSQRARRWRNDGRRPVDMGIYMDMFRRHNQINRVVEEIPGGVRTTTESNSPDLVAQLQAHVSSMYNRVGQGGPRSCA